MKKQNVFFFLLLLAVAAIACGGGAGAPGGGTITVPNSNENVAATIAAGAAQAQSAASTAVAMATEMAHTTNNLPAADTAALEEKFANITPDENGDYSVTITDVELTAVLQSSLAQSSNESPLKDPTFTFTDGLVQFKSTLTTAANGELLITLRPYVTNHKLQFEIVSATFGGSIAPPFTLATIEQALNATLVSATDNTPQEYQLNDLQMGEGTMTITGGKS